MRNICLILFGRMFQIISGTSKTVSGTQNLERNVPDTAHKNVPDISLLLGTLFLLVFPVHRSEPDRGKKTVSNRRHEAASTNSHTSSRAR